MNLITKLKDIFSSLNAALFSRRSAIEINNGENVKFDPDRMYNWLVKSGNITIWFEGSHLMLVPDAEGEEACLLTVQDSLDIYSILEQFGKKLFEESDPSAEYERMVIQEAENSFLWKIETDTLKIFLNDESEFLQISYTGSAPISLDIGLISEIAQIIGIILNNAASNAVKKQD